MIDAFHQAESFSVENLCGVLIRPALFAGTAKPSDFNHHLQCDAKRNLIISLFGSLSTK